MEQVITLRDAWESCELHPDIALSLIKAGKIRAIRFKQTVLIYKEDAKDGSLPLGCCRGCPELEAPG